MNETWAKLSSCDADVTNIIKWWLVKKSHKKYLRMAMQVGGINEVVQETCIAFISSRSRYAHVSYHWTTIAINQTRWTLLAMFEKVIAKTNARAKFLSELPHDLTTPDVQIVIAMNKELAEALKLCSKSLSYRERIVLELRFKQEMTLSEAGEVLQITKERVRQIQAKAIRKLQQPSAAGKLVMFLDR